MPSKTAAYFLTAVGHYGVDGADCSIQLQSDRPLKQLIELDTLQRAVNRECEALRAQLHREAELPEPQPDRSVISLA